MSHNDKIKDMDAFFEVNPITRQIVNKTPAKIVLMQGDHNSERFTFSLPRYIEGHDMAESARANLHYINASKNVKGMCEMKDLKVDPDNPDNVICSWLISGNATKEAGKLAFLIEFECYEGDVLVYSWHTLPHEGISVGESFDNAEEIAAMYADVLHQWHDDLFGLNEEGVKNIETAKAEALAEIEAAGGTHKHVEDFMNGTGESTVLERVIQPEAATFGYKMPNGKKSTSTNDKLVYTEKLSVKVGEILYSNSSTPLIRYACAYSGDAVVPESGMDNTAHNVPYVVPEGIDGVVLTIYLNTGGDLSTVPSINCFREVAKIATDTTLTKDMPANAKAVGDILNTLGVENLPKYTRQTGDIASGDLWELEENDIKTDNIIAFSGNITTLDKLIIGHGQNISYITIDNSNIYRGTNTTPIPHGLTIENNLQVTITVKSETNYNAKISIVSNGVEFTYSVTENLWQANRGAVFVKSEGSTLTDCTFTWTCRNYGSKVFAFGDSYFGHASTNRWVYYLLRDGYTNVLLNGFGGEASVTAKPSLDAALTHGTPKFIFWCLGMNDTENNAMNTNWKNAVDHLISVCSERGITPILATIPNTPTRNNTYKNNYVKSLGCRYVDFAKAVGGEVANSPWYSGMLDEDQIHPSTSGALALYHQVLVDFPEITLR